MEMNLYFFITTYKILGFVYNITFRIDILLLKLRSNLNLILIKIKYEKQKKNCLAMSRHEKKLSEIILYYFLFCMGYWNFSSN